MRVEPGRPNETQDGERPEARSRRYALLALGFVAVALAYLTGGLRFVDDKLLEARFALFDRTASGDLAIVAIDKRSLREFGTWPWSRAYHAEAIDALLEAGARRIALDIDFSSASNAEADLRFKESLERGGARMVLPVFKQLRRDADDQQRLDLTEPLAAFRGEAAIASVSLQPDRDGVLRRAPYEEAWQNGSIPFLASELAGVAPPGPRRFHVDFGIAPGTIPEISYVDVLAGRFDPRQVAGKNVIIGATALELSDYLTVPRWGVLAGAHVLALAYESLNQDRALHGIHPAAVLALTLALMLAFGLRFPGWSARRGLAVLALTGAAVTAAALVAHRGGLLLDTSAPLLAMALCFVSGIARRSTWQARWLVRQHREIRCKDTLMNGVVENSFDAILILDPAGRIEETNPAAAAMFGDEGEALTGRHIDELIPQATKSLPPREGDVAAMADADCREMTARRPDDSVFPVEITVRALATEDRHWQIAFVRDITERKAHQEELEYQALHDTLTGLPNRTLLYRRLNEAIAHASRTGEKVAFLLLDLDRFKEVNDTLGHHIGDVLLQQIGRRLRTPLRKTDMIARLGGDEFAVVFHPVGDHASLKGAAERLHKALEEPLRCQGLALDIDASIGIVLYPDDGADATELIQRADVAMYQAKNATMPTAFYDRDQDHHSVRHLTLTGELKRAVDGEEFELYYQPKIDAVTEEVVGVEALARWTHPELGAVRPDQFIALAEQTGLIKGLTKWALKTAIAQCARWQEAGLDLSVAVNLSPKIMQDRDLPTLIGGLLDEYGLDPEHLILEITESAIMADPDGSKAIMELITERGVRFSIDDFGTGYSSLALLRKLPVHELKIDRSFVIDMERSENDAVIVKSIIELAHNIGLSVVAEGVETSDALRHLARLGTDVAQGFYINLPTPANHFEDWLRARRQGDGEPQLRAVAGGAG